MNIFDTVVSSKLCGGSGGGVPSWNDMPDKPFGEEENAVLLPVTQFAVMEDVGFAIAGYIDIKEGKTYTVNWNGVDYSAEGFLVVGDGGVTTIGLGNPGAFGGEDNNLPFSIACIAGFIMAVPFDGSTAVNVGITGYGVKKIATEFLPKHLHWGEMMDTVVLAEGEYTSEYDSTYGSFSAYGEWSKEQLEVPSTFTFVFDGETYEISGTINIPDLGDMFGNLYFLNAIAGTNFENTGEPFLGWVSDWGFNIFLMDTTPTAHSVKFTAIQEVVKRIPERYVGNAAPYCVRAISEGDDWSVNTTVKELDEAWNSGRQIILKAGEESGDLGMLVVYYLHARYRISYTDENAYGAVYLFHSFVDSFAPYSLIPKADGTYEVRTGS